MLREGAPSQPLKTAAAMTLKRVGPQRQRVVKRWLTIGIPGFSCLPPHSVSNPAADNHPRFEGETSLGKQESNLNTHSRGGSIPNRIIDR